MRTMCCGGRRGTSETFPPVPEPERIRTTEPPQLGERRVLIEREGTTGYVKVMFHAPAATDEDFFPMLVLDAVLTGAKGVNLWSSFRGVPPQRKARLYTALVERGLASMVSGAIMPTAQPFLYTLSFTAMKGVPLDAVEYAAFEEIERVRTDGVNLAELARAKRQLRARLVFENDSVTNIAHQLGYFETIAGPDYLTGAAATDRGRHRRTGMGRRPSPPWTDDANRRLVPSSGVPLMFPTVAAGLSPVRVALDNGAVVIVQEASATPAVSINATFLAGSIHEPDALTGLAYLTGRVIDRGTERRTADEIAGELDLRGVSLRIGTTRHTMTLSCTCLAEDFEDVLAIVMDVARRPTFPEEELAKRRAESMTALRQDEDNPAVRAVETLSELLYGAGHPYGRRAKGTVETLERIDRACDCRLSRAATSGPLCYRSRLWGMSKPRSAIDCAAMEIEGWTGAPAGPIVVPPPAAPAGAPRAHDQHAREGRRRTSRMASRLSDGSIPAITRTG